MRCEYVKQELDRYIQGDLSERDSKEINRHLSKCQNCSDALSRIRKLQGLLEDTLLPPVPEGFTERLMQRARRQQYLQRSSEPTVIRLWEWLGRADLKKAAVAAAVIIGLSLGLLMGVQTSRQSYKAQVAGSSVLVDAYHLDYLTEAPENSLSRVYTQMISSRNKFEE
jgi:anti-sigma factor RsiW